MTDRTLPIRVPPERGEVLESWLGTLAALVGVPFGDFLRFVADSTGGGVDLRRPGLSVYLTDREVTSIAACTGATSGAIRAMTMSRFDGRLVSIDPAARRLWRSSWEVSRTRFCPACLSATGGRWQLRWRLPWVFACDVHHCLLAEECPVCGRDQRVSPRWLPWTRIPDLQHCMWSLGRHRPSGWCDGDLTGVPCAWLAADDPLMAASARLSTVLRETTAAFGVYALSPASSLDLLADLRMLSARMLSSLDLADVDEFLGASERNSIAARLGELGINPRDWGNPETFSARAPAVITGVGIALALNVLGAGSVREAGDRLRSIVGPRGALSRTLTPKDLRQGNASLALQAVDLSAISEHQSPSNQLRYRISSALPRFPPTDSASGGVALRSIPTAFWRDWTLRLFATKKTRLELASSSLSALLLIVGTRVSIQDAYRLLGGAVTRERQTKFADILHRDPLWPNIAEAIVRLADHLVAHPSPIDYQRRRALSYDGLLPAELWADIYKDNDLGNLGVAVSERLARSWLFERVSGQPPQLSPFGDASERKNRRRNQLIDRFTRNVIGALDREAMRFLCEHQIVDEPVVWSPPLSLVTDLELPGPDPATVPVSQLYAALAVKGATVTAAAQQFGLSIPFVRLLLEQFPIDAFPVLGAPRPRQKDRLKDKLTPEKLTMLNHCDGLSMADVGAQFGVSRRTMARLAHEYGIEIRRCASKRRMNIDPTWLRIEHVQNHRSLSDIADELGCSTNPVRRVARQHAIPVYQHRVPPDTGDK